MLRIISLLLLLFGNIYGCNQREEQYGYICVCDADSCDAVPAIDNLDDSSLQIFYTSAAEPGFNVRHATFSNNPDPNAFVITVNPGETYQSIYGFGAAFTDAAGIVISSLNEAAQQQLISSYFGENGIGYSLMRVPIGCHDFSTRTYSYDDTEGDTDLSNFNLANEDYTYKIPYILRAQELTHNQLKLIGTPWTAPIWMKTPSSWTGGSILREEYYQLWADYYVKFFEEYRRNGISFWGLTTGNEPLTGFFATTAIPSMGWTANQQAKWIAENLGPTLQSSDYRDLKVISFDDGLLPMPFFVPYLMENDSAIQYIDGVATHTYWDYNMSPRIRNQASSKIKHVFRISSEGSHYQTTPQLGDWSRAYDYITNIIEVLKDYDYAGWVEYNLALDTTGGPTYLNDKGDAPIIINESGTEFYKQPTFYAIGHFSKFIVPDSTRLGVAQANDYVQSVAFRRPDGLRVLLVHNYNDGPASIQLQDSGKFSETLALSPNSINTIVYRGY